MIATQKDARRILAAHYPGLKIRLTTRTQIGVRPVVEMSIGLPTLVWRKLDIGADSAVRIGQLTPGGGIDWGWDAS
ncbi:MAG: hypothetical protein KJ558_10065 [Gammaproteobacteria bacterium]|nr:hypothetical protein [Gammaproteobacteria bacterium]MBU1655151.1 hypothetical protein [Gammaproteobacteria bacterium]MBU1959962.1 hypothetical protein [Gammaproteobacteria bacterium]